MLDLPDEPVLDKASLVGECVRLPLIVDADRLLAEVASVPPSAWGSTAGRVGVQKAAQALFLRGYAPAEGDKPIVDREALNLVPYVREVIEQLIPAPPLRCLLARLPGGASVPPHIDDGCLYFWKTLRIHIAVQTHDRAWMICGERSYRMKPGEVWALNNNTLHAVWNADPVTPRTHLICDFLAAPGLLALIARGERDLGRAAPEVDAHFAALSSADATAGG